MDWDEKITSLEISIRAGQIDDVQRLLIPISQGAIPRRLIGSLARIARRVDKPLIGLRLLYPIVRNKALNIEPATEEEKLVYSSLLMRIGALDEAQSVLATVTQPSAQNFLYRAYSHIYQWDYASASPFLEKYVQHVGLSRFERINGALNLAASYTMIGETEKAQYWLEQIEIESSDQNWSAIRRDGYEIGIQLALLNRDWTRAAYCLNTAEKIPSARSTATLLLSKWGAYFDLERHGPSTETLERIKSVRTRAFQLRDWETLRDCDLHLAGAVQDAQLFHQVYFGTPYVAFRQKMLEKCSSWMAPPSEETISIGHSMEYLSDLPGDFGSSFLDLKRGCFTPKGAQLTRGALLHKLIAALASDSYRPLPVGRVFSMVFSGEHFDRESSVHKIEALISRLRSWLAKNDIPLKIESQDRQYRLRALEPQGCRVESTLLTTFVEEKSRFVILLDELQAAELLSPFTSKQAASSLGVSVRLVNSLLKWALQMGRIHSVGAGRSIRYAFVTNTNRKTHPAGRAA